ncbi:MAG: tetratricopeptide repeat protein [Planctomycetota bacterium]
MIRRFEDERAEEALLATVEVGRQDADAGHLDAAERCFQRVLRAARGTGNRAEIKACSSLVTIYSREQRDFETLPLARRLVENARESGEASLLCRGLAAIAGAFNDIQDYPRAEAALDDLEEAIPLLSAADAPRYRAIVPGTRSDIALARGDLALAQEELERFRLAFTRDMVDGEKRWLWVHEAHVLLHAGRPRDAKELLACARVLPVPSALGGLAIEYLETWATLELDGPIAALVPAEQMLFALDPSPHDAFGSSQRIRYLTLTGDLLREHCDSPDLLRLAYDLAGTAVIARMFQLDAFVRRTPVLGRLTADDETALAEYRHRFRQQQTALLKSVAKLFTFMRRTQHWIPLPLSESRDSLALICPWCERLCSAGDVWVPIGHYVPEEKDLRVSHSICPSCTRLLDSSISRS